MKRIVRVIFIYFCTLIMNAQNVDFVNGTRQTKIIYASSSYAMECGVIPEGHEDSLLTDDVVDYVSGEIWKSFFRNLLQGNSKRESLLNAIKDIWSYHGGFYTSPKYWTPFILIDGID